MFPGAQRMNRGNHEISALVRACKANNVTDLVIVHETRGQPGLPVHFPLFFLFYWTLWLKVGRLSCSLYTCSKLLVPFPERKEKPTN